MTCNNPNLDLININAYTKFGEICLFVLKMWIENEIRAKIKGHNSGATEWNMTCNNPNLDLVIYNAFIKFGENLTIFSQDNER